MANPPASVPIAGVDLAWGERNGDGLCLLRAWPDGRAEVAASAHVFGDDALFAWLETHLGVSGPALVCVDAPLVCPNAIGARPADRAAQRLFARFHAGPHPANAARCARPLRVAAILRERLGFALHWDPALAPGERLALEVFPHPATVRWFGLTRIVKYKRGPVAARRMEFGRLQGFLRTWLAMECPEIRETPALTELLAAPWTKPAEDRLDALLCALVGWQHWRSGGRGSEVLGDAEAGFIVVPLAAPPPGLQAPSSPA